MYELQSNPLTVCRQRVGYRNQSVVVWLLAAFLFYGGMPWQSGVAGSDDSRWEWRVGPIQRSGTRIRADWDSDAVLNRLRPFFRRQSSEPSALPPLTGYADRDYVDGFVYMDPGTADPETDVPGLTWYWGYESPAQYIGDAVLFHSEPGSDYRVDETRVAPWLDTSRLDMTGLDIAVGRCLARRGKLTVGLSAGISWYPERSVDFALRRIVARDTATTWRYVDSYGAPHTPFPSAPYEGLYDPPIEGPGYLLHNEPDVRDVEMLSSRSRDWEAESTLDVDTAVFDARLGPSVGWSINDRFVMRLAARARAAHVDARARAYTTISPTSAGPITFEDREHNRQWILGGGVEAEANFILHRGWHAGFSATADWWADSLTLDVEPFNTKIDLGQWTMAAYLGRGF